MRASQLLVLLIASLACSAGAQVEDEWAGNWVEGEKGAHHYTKIHLARESVSFAPGGNDSRIDYFAPLTSRVWCRVNYKIVSRFKGATYPNQPAWSQDIARSKGWSYEIRELELEHTKCTGFRLLQLAFHSDIQNYVDVVQYDENRRLIGRTHYQKVLSVPK